MAKKRPYQTTSRARKKVTAPFGSRTDIGCIRDHNEDSLIVMPPLFAIADGMGGHAAGEVASEIAVNVLSRLAPAHPDGEALGRAVEEANREIIRASLDGRGREGMGTTITAAMIEGERLVIAQVGDSRAYLLHQGSLQQLTRDHSLMADMIEAGKLTPEEARFHPNRSVITRALGSDPHTRPDIYEIDVNTGDRVLLCSDGLSGMLHDEEIEKIMRRTQNPQLCASQLVNEAIAAGGHDNITVIVADVSEYAEVKRRKVARKTKIGIGIVFALLAFILAAGAWGAHAFLSTTAYLGNDNGKVAIYQGVPESVFGLSFSEHIYTTNVSVDDLQPGTANRLEEGIRVDSVQAAEDLTKSYTNETAAKQAEEKEKAAQQQERQKEKQKDQKKGADAS